MAIMNLLKANWTGSVGKTTGQEYGGKRIIKAKIDGRVGLNQIQTENLRKFERLNRVAAVMARHYDYVFIPEIYRGMKHNWFLKNWKWLMQPDFPNTQEFDRIYGYQKWQNIIEWGYDRNSNSTYCDVETSGLYQPVDPYHHEAIIFDAHEHPRGPYVFTGGLDEYQWSTDEEWTFPWGLHMVLTGEKVQDEVWYGQPFNVFEA